MNYTTTFTEGYLGSNGYIGSNFKTTTSNERKSMMKDCFKKEGLKITIREAHYRTYYFTITLSENDITKECYHAAKTEKYFYNSINQYHFEDDERFTETGKEKIRTAVSIVNSFNYDKSNVLVDYFDCGFYDFYKFKVK